MIDANILPPGTGDTARAGAQQAVDHPRLAADLAVNQPASTARKPSGETQTKVRRNQRLV
jgi:hypothetical protein